MTSEFALSKSLCLHLTAFSVLSRRALLTRNLDDLSQFLVIQLLFNQFLVLIRYVNLCYSVVYLYILYPISYLVNSYLANYNNNNNNKLYNFKKHIRHAHVYFYYSSVIWMIGVCM